MASGVIAEIDEVDLDLLLLEPSSSDLDMIDSLNLPISSSSTRNPSAVMASSSPPMLSSLDRTASLVPSPDKRLTDRIGKRRDRAAGRPGKNQRLAYYHKQRDLRTILHASPNLSSVVIPLSRPGLTCNGRFQHLLTPIRQTSPQLPLGRPPFNAESHSLNEEIQLMNQRLSRLERDARLYCNTV